MTPILSQFSYIIAIVVFLSAVGFHLSRKNINLVFLYILQSSAIAVLLFIPAIQEMDFLLLLAAVLTLAIKAVFAPYFFLRLIRRHELTFTSNAYLSLPLTLITLALLAGLAYSHVFKSFVDLSGGNMHAVSLAIAAIFVSIFLSINRRGALSQIIGVLSLENTIVALTLFLGVVDSSGLDIGVSFDIGVWVVIAVLFLSMIYKQFGSLDVSTMKKLKEE
jgi:hydrogenase-4 component E